MIIVDSLKMTYGRVLDATLVCRVITTVSSGKPSSIRNVRMSNSRLGLRYSRTAVAGGLSRKTTQSRRWWLVGKYDLVVRDLGLYRSP
jgi:hypothetical protein